MRNFPGGKPPDPHFYSLRSHLVSAPQHQFRSDGPAMYSESREDDSDLTLFILEARYMYFV